MRAITITLLALALIGVAITTGSHFGLVPRVKAHEGCSVKTLRGNYGGVWTGLFNPVSPPATPQSVSSFLYYDGMEVSSWDGAGNFTASDVFAIGGTTAQPATDTGTYTVDSNCTGTLTLTSGLTFDFIITHNKTEIDFAETDGNPTVVTETQLDPEP